MDGRRLCSIRIDGAEPDTERRYSSVPFSPPPMDATVDRSPQQRLYASNSRFGFRLCGENRSRGYGVRCWPFVQWSQCDRWEPSADLHVWTAQLLLGDWRATSSPPFPNVRSERKTAGSGHRDEGSSAASCCPREAQKDGRRRSRRSTFTTSN